MVRSTSSFPNLARLLPVFLLGGAVLLGGCDATSTADEAEGDAPQMASEALSAAVSTLTTATSLSTEQANALRKRLAKYDGDREPGMLWLVAADVHDQLTEEQIEVLKRRVREHRADRRQDGSRREARGHFRKMLRHRLGALDLSDAQKEDLRALRNEHRDEIQSFRRACRAGTVNEAEARAWSERRTEMRDAFRTVLTEEQRQQIDARREDRRARREKVRAARADALDVTDEQRARFNDLRAQVDGPGARILRRCNREGQQDRPVAAILTDEQKEIVMIHRVLRYGVMKKHKERRATQS
jgi:hypothetical protein